MTRVRTKSSPACVTFRVFSAGLLWATLIPLSADAQSFTPTKHSEYQAVDASGFPAWPPGGGPPYPIEMTGVVINNPWDMLNYTTAPSPQWQVYIQTTAADDFGGTALYMRRYTPWPPFTDLYPGTGWDDEIDRLNYPVYEPTGTPVTEPLRRGDRIKVQAEAPGLFYNGKYNINTQHSNDPNKEFHITILERDMTPVTSDIDLSALKHADDSFIFDSTRATGCEHYQASLVHLDNLRLDNPEDWALYDPDNPLIVRQGSLTFPMVLGTDPDLLSVNANALHDTPFSLTAILDQEGSDPTTGYRLWLTNAADLGFPTTIIPEPGTATIFGLGGLLIALGLRRRRL